MYGSGRSIYNGSLAAVKLVCMRCGPLGLRGSSGGVVVEAGAEAASLRREGVRGPKGGSCSYGMAVLAVSVIC